MSIGRQARKPRELWPIFIMSIGWTTIGQVHRRLRNLSFAFAEQQAMELLVNLARDIQDLQPLRPYAWRSHG